MVSLEFFIDLILPAIFGPGLNSASDINEYQGCLMGGKGGQRVRLTTFPPSRADSLKTQAASTPWNPKGLSRPVQGCLNLLHDDNVQNIRQVCYNLSLSESPRVEDFRFPLLCSGCLTSSGMLCGLTIVEVTDKLSQNVGNKLPTYAL
jgi:hypothetical protein